MPCEEPCLPPLPTDGGKYELIFDGERPVWSPLGTEGQFASIGSNGLPLYVNQQAPPMQSVMRRNGGKKPRKPPRKGKR